MSTPPTDPMESLVRGARGVSPKASFEHDDVVARALLVSRARARRRTTIVRMTAYASLVVVILVAGLAVRPREDETSPLATSQDAVERPSEITLPTGDRVLSVGGASLVTTSLSQDARSLSLASGEALFDVRPGAPFVVETPTARVRVLGTVFRVSVERERTFVRVYEGRVEVVDAAGTRTLTAGQTSYAPATPSRLDAYGDAFARARSTAPNLAAEPASPAVAQAEPGGLPLAAPPQPAPRPSPREPRAAAVTLDDARRLLANGDFEGVLAAVRASTEAARSADWTLLEADALRGISRFAEAATAFERAASLASPTRAAASGLSAARIRLDALSDAAGALRSLDRSHADAPGSPVEDASMALRVRALRALGRQDDARAVARVYVARFPSGGQAAALSAWLDTP